MARSTVLLLLTATALAVRAGSPRTPMRILPASFESDYAAIRHVRVTVFVNEQHVPEEIELDERDPLCLHLLAYDDVGAPIGTGRLDVGYGGKIGRVAVLASARRSGVGTALMSRLHDLAAGAGLGSVWCNAQISAAAFYAQLGYAVGNTSTGGDQACPHGARALAGDDPLRPRQHARLVLPHCGLRARARALRSRRRRDPARAPRLAPPMLRPLAARSRRTSSADHRVRPLDERLPKPASTRASARQLLNGSATRSSGPIFATARLDAAALDVLSHIKRLGIKTAVVSSTVGRYRRRQRAVFARATARSAGRRRRVLRASTWAGASPLRKPSHIPPGMR